MMQRLFLASLFLCACPSFSQNILSNPGFENGLTGWSEFWTRDAKAGTALLSTSPVHSGSHALHLKHTGKNDWAFMPKVKSPVQAGQIYEFSGWAQTLNPTGEAELSVVIYDSVGTAIDWAFSAKPISLSAGKFQQFKLRAIIPAGIFFILPRIVGQGVSEFFIDDLHFEYLGKVPFGLHYTLENANLKLDIQPVGFGFTVLEKTGNKVYQIAPVNQFELLRVDTLQHSYTFHCHYLPGNFDIAVGIQLDNNTINFHLRGDSSSRFTDKINFPGTIPSDSSQFLVVPRATGILHPVNKPYPYWSYQMWSWKSTMSFCGVTNLQNGYMISSEDPWDTEMETSKAWNQNYYTLQLVHHPSKSHFGYNRKFHYSFFDKAGYVAMCQWYRKHAETKGYVKTFAQKIAKNPNVEKLLGAADFWALESHFQTKAFIDSLADFGMDKLLLSLSGGWGAGENKSERIKQINDLGMISSRYDLYTDVWPPTHPEETSYRTEGYPGDVVVNADLSLRTGWLAYLNGNIPFQGYYTCSIKHSAYARKWTAEDLKTNPYNGRFIDVELSSSLVECYSPDHPTGRREDAMARIAALDIVKNEFNLVTGVEEAHDWAFPVADFGEGTMTMAPATNAGYDWSTPLTDPGEDYLAYNVNPIFRIPLHGLVYHDVHVPTWYTGDGASKVPASWDDKDLFNLLYATMPLFMPPDAKYWAKNREKFLTSYHLISSVFRRTGQSQMIGHKMVTSDFQVQQSSFANGWSVTANFGKTNYSFGDNILASKGFFASSNSSEQVFRVQKDSKTLAVAHLSDRLFMNPYGAEIKYKGVRTTGSILLKKEDTGLQIVFCGIQSSVDLHPDSIPWPLNVLKVLNRDKSRQSQIELLSDGWIRINKLAGQIFYHIEGSFKPISIKNAQIKTTLNAKFQLISMGRFRNKMGAKFITMKNGPVIIRANNLNGKEFILYKTNDLKAGNHTVQLNPIPFGKGLTLFALQSLDGTFILKQPMNY